MKKLLTIFFAVVMGLNLSAQDDCGSGTIWDAETSKCVPDPENCGAGTYWNYLESQCLPFDNCPEDLDNDGLVAVSDLLLLLSAYSDVCLMVGGCTDYDATNFDPNADFDDGSCVLTVLGCMSEFACNYLAEATEDDGTCDFFTTDLFEENEALLIGSSSFLNGCPDGIDVWDDNEVVLDYSGGPPILVFSGDDAAYLLEEFGESSGAVILQVLQNSTLSFCENIMYISNETFTFPAIPWNGSSFEIELLFDMYLAPAGTALGCGDSEACNFTPCLFSENELCEYAMTGFDCNGNCFVDTDGDGICDEFEIAGCEDLAACNFDETATEYDGSCLYIDECGVCGGFGFAEGTCDCEGSIAESGYDCDGDCFVDTDGDGICDEFEIAGCEDLAACNFDETATEYDGSCLYIDECGVCGGFGFAEGTCDCEGSIAESGYNCDGDCFVDTDGDGICDEFEIDGCTDVIACNYDSGATNDGVDCIYTEEFYDCDGNCLNDSNNNNLCDEFEVYGCTIESADNFDPEALIDNGTCQWYDGLVNSLSYEVYSFDGVEGTTTYRLFANFSTVDIEVVAVYGTNAVPWQLIPSTSFYQDASGTPLASGIDAADFSEFPSLEFDTWLALGAAPGEPDGTNTAGMDGFYPSFEAGGALNVNTFLGASIFVIPGQSSQSIPINGKVLLAQITTDGFTDVLLNLALRNSDNESIEVEGMTLTFPCLVDSDGDGICDSDELLGCSIDSADNYNPFATENDGSCEISGCLTSIACNYNPIATYDDGSCIFYCPGCTDDVACNYDSGALQEDGSCEYPFDLYGFDYVDCEGQCLSDEDGDGVCLEDEIYGCTEIEACNFNGEATENDGTCEFQSCAGCMDEEACNFDPEATLGDASCEYESCAGCMYEFACNYDPAATIAANETCEFGTCPGCTDPEACNYNPTVTEDDGSCLYLDECGVCGGFGFAEGTCDCEGSIAESGYNCDGSCVIDTDGDGVCDEFEIAGCTDNEAENYDETATDEDDSCVMGWMQLGQDIDGEAAYDMSGYSVSFSSDGKTVAIGATGNDSNGSFSGHVRIYAWNSDTSTWDQQGADIDGEAANDYSGHSVSLSSDGTTVAIGAHYNDGNGSDSGHVRIYAWDGSSWNQLGEDIDGEAANAFVGASVSLSSDGTVVAIGSANENFYDRVRIYAWDGSSWNQLGADIDGMGNFGGRLSLSSDGTIVAIGEAGISRIYAWDGSSWNQLGAAIDGEAANDWSGTSVSLSSDGTVVAIGAHLNDGNGENSGHIRTYLWDGSSWNQFGGDIDGEAAGDFSGWSVSLSSDGTTVAIGAPYNDGNGSESGHVRIYSIN